MPQENTEKPRQEDPDTVALTRREYEREIKAELFRREMGWKPRLVLKDDPK